MAGKRLKTKAEKGTPITSNPERLKQRPMPEDPKDLARAMFRQGDIKLFGGQDKKKPGLENS